MDIVYLENKLQKIENSNYKSVIELIINAVRDYPVYEVKDTDIYFQEIKNLLCTNEITFDILDSYIKSKKNDLPLEEGDKIWIFDSLNSLIEAFDLMRLYKIEFKNILKMIESLK